jgi:tetratricopeptide (TPR) repeat protein
MSKAQAVQLNPGSGSRVTEVRKPTPRELLGLTDQEFEEMGQLGAMYYAQGDLERARIVFEGMVEADPLSSSAHAALGALYLRTNQDEKALEHLDLAIKLDDSQLSAYVNRAEARLKLKQVEGAVADLRRAIDLDRTGEDPAANRARMMAQGLQHALRVRNLVN